MSEFNTGHLQGVLARIRAGDPAARNELIRGCLGRLELLARKMLKTFPAVRRFEDTGDVLNQAVIRLLRSLEAIDVGSTRDFFNFAATHIRRELLDLVRHYQGPLGAGRHEKGGLDDPGGPKDRAAPEPPADLERWAELHERVADLPAEEREVFSLTFYHGWTREQIAELFGINERTVRRRWHAAVQKLAQQLGELPLAD
jgi:RNA polymerase sigma-70 factor (ECF subfamily)